mmetsp:Transcript_4014/g.10317  ORF Transcript_4014/g.10317 Transcript_4014/m.10317 type:complete len:96 (-) Transcript_4014:102-389(-)|eukprot:CAMPEP_0197417244 /NCGR_PEP_ID=MMETSP1170-20131217/3347_1 /TAXON_ID=54406 /ORGANISM="Sarcinochrysis sp, Strain CCMP770" /LENGTH=95 /DNA_ID=CAMNT_0042944199 /DNA_START=45 /DNA_END=332 /DNA_ORIENTATION=+
MSTHFVPRDLVARGFLEDGDKERRSVDASIKQRIEALRARQIRLAETCRQFQGSLDPSTLRRRTLLEASYDSTSTSSANPESSSDLSQDFPHEHH